MIKKILIILLILTTVGVLAILRRNQPSVNFITEAKQVGELTVTWLTNPLFNETNFLPGDVTTPRTVTVFNGAAGIQPLGFRAEQTSVNPNNFPEQIHLKIYENNILKQDLLLSDFFNQSQNNGYIKFSDLAPGSTTTYKFIATFDQNAGNTFKNARVMFNISVGIAAEIPDQCKYLLTNPATKFVFGTDKKETLTGGNYPNIIFGFGGNDMINGNNKDDCLIGGEGNDTIHGNNGKNFIDGGPGTDNCKQGIMVSCEK